MKNIDIESQPYYLSPCYKPFIWGGTKLYSKYNKKNAPLLTAESWELACNPDGESLLITKYGQILSINDLLKREFRHFLGSDFHGDSFPILIKLIDAKDALSIQVHPSDTNANTALGESGKAEMWYVVECDRNAYIYLGFKKNISRSDFIIHATNGTICNLLNKVPVKKGDVYYIQPGIIHAIGGGITIAEIQQNSNTTFRIFDYDRIDASGRRRALHIDRASEVLSYQAIIPSECRSFGKVHFPEFTMTELFCCPHFCSYSVEIQHSNSFFCGSHSFQHLICVNGHGKIICKEQTYPFMTGTSFFLPASLGEYVISGHCKLLLTQL